MLLGIYDDLLFAAAQATERFKLLLIGEPASPGARPPVLQTNDLAIFRTGYLPWGGMGEDVAAGGGLIAAVGIEVSPSWVGGQYSLAVSTDGGQTFTRKTHPEGGRNCYYGAGSVAFGQGLFVLVAPNTSGFFTVYTSPDAVTWIQRTSPFVGSARVKFVNGVFVLYGFDTVNNFAAFATSADGITFTRGPNIWPAVTSIVMDYENNVPGAYGSAPITSVDYVNGRWVFGAHPRNGNCEIAFSTGLTSFTKQQLPWGNDTTYRSATVSGVAYYNGLYYATGVSGLAPYKQLAVSANLISWSRQASALDDGLVGPLLDMGGKLVAFVTTGYPSDQVFWDGAGGSSYSPSNTPVYSAFSTTDASSFTRVTLPPVLWKVTRAKLVT